jgi:FixJ family two-component response regulator
MIHCLPNARRIGLVEDDLSVRKALGRLLRSHGYECIAYESAEAALADPELLRMHCLVLDIQLPEMNGFELRDHLVELGSPIPYIFFTGHAESDFVDWSVRMGDSLYLRKPVDDNQLLATIEKLITQASGLLDS